MLSHIYNNLKPFNHSTVHVYIYKCTLKLEKNIYYLFLCLVCVCVVSQYVNFVFPPKKDIPKNRHFFRGVSHMTAE